MSKRAGSAAYWMHDQHALESMPQEAAFHDTYFDWAENHETIVVLEGGFHQDLRVIKSAFECGFNFKETHTLDPSPYPWAPFCEDEETMNGMMTCVGIIVPEPIYAMAKAIRESKAGEETGRIWPLVKDKNFSPWELSFIELINSKELAR
jgi:hypothetical protein